MIIRELVTLLGFKVDDTGQKEYNKNIDQTKQKQQSLTGSFLKAQVIYAAAQKTIGAAVSYFKDTIVGGTIEMEGYRTQLEMMTGGAQEAADTLARLRDNTVDPLFGTGNLVEAYKGLRTIGMEGAAAEKMVTTLGDMANGSAENFNMLAQTLQKTAATGKFGAMQMNQLAKAGFGAADMAQSLGISEAQLRQDLDDGKIGFNELTKAMQVATSEGGKFFGNAEKHANTLNGRIMILRDLIASTGDAIGTKVLPEMVGVLKYFTELAKAGQETFVNGFATIIKEAIHWIYQIMIMFEVLKYRIEDSAGAFDPLINFIKTLAEAVATAMGGILPFLVKFALLIMAIATNIAKFLTPIIKEVGAIARDVFSTLAQWLGPITSLVLKSGGAFEGLGKFIAAILRPALAVAAGIKGISLAIMGFKAVTGAIKGVSTAFQLLSGSMSVMRAASEGNRMALMMLEVQMIKAKIATLAHAAAVKIAAIAQKIAAVASKAWAVIQGILNAVMSANPIALIILGVIALIAVIVLLVKNWDKVKEVLITGIMAIGNFFKMIATAIAGFFRSMWEKIVGFFKKYGEIILQVLAVILFGIPGLIAVAVRQIIKHWDVIGPALKKILDKVKAFFIDFGKKVAEIFFALVDKIKKVFEPIGEFFAGLWESIVSVAMNVWNVLTGWFTGLVDKIKAVWNGIIGFFTGLWDALMQGPQAAIDFISNAFTSLFDGLKEKLFGFIGKVKEGWDKVTGFFGNAVNGVVNFFTGGDKDLAANTPTKVNDMILTPEGHFETSPDDYIMAMKDPGSLVEAVLRFLGQGMGGPEPAFAGMPSDSLFGNAMMQSAAAPTNYNTSSSNYSESIQAPITVNVNASGMTPDQAQIAVQRGVEDALKGAINSSRGDIPTPEIRRH